MNFRDVELLSTYLDGHLNPSDSTRLESRLSSDPDLRATLDDMRAARGLLRRLPARKAPRNFTLTRKMVGLKPPLPRSYFTFRFATALATLMLLCTFAVNGFASQVALRSAAPAFGMGGGGAPESEFFEAVTEAPAATEAPAEEAPSIQMAPESTETPSAAEDSARSAETPAEKSGETGDQPGVGNVPPIPPVWQGVLVVIVLVGGLTALVLRQSTISKWR
jgi:anti-sigma factor RsiW